MTSNPWSRDWYISCVIDINWNIQTDCNILNGQKPFQIWQEEILANNCLNFAYHFSCEQEPRLPFSIHWETLRVWCKIIRLVQVVYKHVWPMVLLGSRLRIIVAITLQLKVILEIDFSVFILNVKGSLLDFCIMEHYLTKKELNNSALFSKSIACLPLWKSGGYKELFYCLITSLIFIRKFLHWWLDPSIFWI